MLCFCRVNVSSSPVLPIQSPGNVSDSTEVNIDSVKVEILWQRVTYSLDLLWCFTLVCVFLLSRGVLKWLSAYQNLQVTAVLEFTQCTIVIATLRRRPDHRSTSTDQVRSSLWSSNISSLFFAKILTHTLFTFSLFYHLSSTSTAPPPPLSTSFIILRRADAFSLFILWQQWLLPHFPFMPPLSSPHQR